MLTLGVGQMWGATYNLYSGALTEGDYIIYYDGYAMKAGVTSDRFDNQIVTPSNNKITDPTNENLIVWHIAASGDYWTIYNTQNSGKYAASTGAKNKARLLASCTGDNADYCLWSASGTSTYEFVNKKNNANNVNKNLRNNGTNGWACYSTQTGGALTLYKKAASNTPTITKSSSMTTLTYSNGSPVAQSFTIGGSNLTNTVTVTAPTDYEVCKTVDGTYESSISFTNTEVNAANKTVYIRLQSGLSAGNISSRNITIASEDATTQTIAVTGSVPYKIIWMANGLTHATTYVAVGSTLTLPATDPVPNTCGCSGKAFFGWYGGASYSHASMAPSIAAAGNAVNADKTYHAVFADEGEEETPDPITQTLTVGSNGGTWPATGNKMSSAKVGDVTFNALGSGTNDGKYYTSDNSWRFYTNSTSGIKVSVPSGGIITKVKITWKTTIPATPSGWSRNQTTSPTTYTPNSGTEVNEVSFTKTSSGNVLFQVIEVTYTPAGGGTTYSNFETTCCTPLGSIKGSVLEANSTPTSLTLQWDKLSNVDNTTPYSVKYRVHGETGDQTNVNSSNINLSGAKAICTINNLSCNTKYDIWLTAHAATGYCDIVDTLIDNDGNGYSTTQYTITKAGEANGNTFTVVASECNGQTVNLSASPASNYTFTSWTITKGGSGNVEPANATSATTTFTMPADNVTVTAAFTLKQCTKLGTPSVSVDGLDYPYDGVTLSWETIEHADGYSVKIYEGEDVIDSDDLDGGADSYTVSISLAANKTYSYEVTATSETPATYCESDAASDDFTTEDYPAATLTLSEVGGDDYTWGSNLKVNDVIALPSALTYAGCTGKVLVGWSSVEIENPGSLPTENYWAAGAEYTLSSTNGKLYAVYATKQGGKSEEEYTFSSFTAAADVTINTPTNFNIELHKNSASNNPAWNGNSEEARIYAKGSLKITSSEPITKVVFIYNVNSGNSGVPTISGVAGKTNAGTWNANTKTWTGSDSEITFSTSGSSGNIGFKKVTVTTGSDPTYSAYTTVCAAALANPTFDPAEDAEEEYLAAQDLTINGPKDATIYYTMTTDGTEPDDPTDESDEYSSVISMNSRATYWIKAFAKKDASVSEIVEAKYNINLPFTVAEAIAEIPKEGNERAKTYIDGIVCTAGTAVSDGEMIYYISDDGTETNRICIWYGKGLNNDEFTDVTDLKVGDKVRVYGLLNNTNGTTYGHYYVDNSYLTYLQSATVSSIEIGGTATKTAYTAGDNTFSYAGLTATATYNTGYVKDVTSEATWKANSVTSYTVTETEDVSVTATFGGQTSDAMVVGVTYTTKTVKSIYLEYESTYTYKGMALPKPKVYAKYVEDIADEEVTSLVEAASGYDTESAYNKDVVDTYTINVAYQLKEATYTVEVRAIFNDVDHPYTPSEATTIIVEAIGENQSSDYIYVAGKVSAIDGSIDYNTLKYYISNDGTTTGQLYVYKGKYINNANFTNNNILVVGDEVVVQAQAQNYEGNLPELKSSQVMKHYRAPQFTFDDIVAGDEFEYDYSTDMAVTPTKNTGNAAFTLESDDESIVSIVDGKLHAAGVGTTKITASREATNLANQMNYSAKTAEFYVTVIAKRTRYTVTFNGGGATGGTAPEAIDVQLAGATVNLPASSSYSWPKHGFIGWNVTAGETPVAVTDGHFTMPEANVTITAQWAEIATTQIIFNVNGSTNVVAAVDVPQNEEYEFTQTTDPINGYTFVGWAESEEEDDVETELATIDSYTPAVNEESKTLYAVFTRADNSNPNIGKYSKATNAPSKWDAEYLLVYEAEGNTANVWNGTDANGCYATATISNNMIEKPSGAVTLTVAKMTGGHSLLIGGGTNNGKYVGAFASNQADFVFSNSAVAATLSYDNENNCALIYIGSRYIQYNTQSSGRFRGYASGQQKVQLYKKITAPIYYTTAPAVVYDVEYALGGGAWKENEGCNDVKVKAGKTYNICEDQPVRDHFNFVKWQIGGVDASGTITVNANTTITAVWDPKTESNVTYKAGTGTGSDVVVEDVEEGTEVTLKAIGEGDGQANFTKSGYDFVGWLNNDVLQKAGETFEMPTTDVTLIAQWKKQNVVKMSLITDASQLMNGMEVIFGYIDEDNSNNSAVNGDITGTNKFFTSVTSDVTFNNDNTVTFGSGALVLTIEKADGGWKLRKNATNYLTNSGDNLSWSTEENATKWSISFEDDNAKIATGSYWIQYNSSSPRFKTYSSTQKAIQLYGKATVVNGTTSISEIGYVEGDVIVLNNNAALTIDANIAPTTVIVPSGSTVTVNDNKTVNANTVIVENGGTLNIYDEGTIKTTETLIIHSTLGKGTGTGAGSGNNPGACGQITNGDNIAVNGDVYLELELTQDAKASAGWYAFSVPFPVDAMNGVYYGDTKLQNEVGYAIMSHDGALRAENKYAWKKFRGIMQPGVFYVITVGDTDYKTLRFKKVAGEALVASTSVAVSPFQTQTGNNADGAWNGIGNPNLAISNLSTPVTVMQFYDHKTNTFIGRDHSVNLVVGSAFFIQYNATSSVSIPTTINNGHGYLAPQRERNAVEETIYEVQLTNVATGELEDNVFLTAREDATNEYVIGRDVAKMSMGTAKCAQMWVPAYGTQLCAADFQLANDRAEYPLTFTSPVAGNYSISTVANENADIYLTLDGSIIWNLSMGAYELELPQGTTTEYGLLLQAKAPNTATGVDSVLPSEVNIQKVIIDEHVYILRGEQMYDVTGKMVK